MRTLPWYVSELDLVLIDNKNRMLAYTTIWVDAKTTCGYFEPMSVHPTAQRKGIGRMLLQEGLYRLQAYGARYARICPPNDNGAAKKLYTSVGFVSKNQDWSRLKPMRE